MVGGVSIACGAPLGESGPPVAAEHWFPRSFYRVDVSAVPLFRSSFGMVSLISRRGVEQEIRLPGSREEMRLAWSKANNVNRTRG